MLGDSRPNMEKPKFKESLFPGLTSQELYASLTETVQRLQPITNHWHHTLHPCEPESRTRSAALSSFLIHLHLLCGLLPMATQSGLVHAGLGKLRECAAEPRGDGVRSS